MIFTQNPALSSSNNFTKLFAIGPSKQPFLYNLHLQVLVLSLGELLLFADQTSCLVTLSFETFSVPGFGKHFYKY